MIRVWLTSGLILDFQCFGAGLLLMGYITVAIYTRLISSGMGHV